MNIISSGMRRRNLREQSLGKNVGCNVGLFGKFPAIFLHPAKEELTWTCDDIRGRDSHALHEINLELAEITYIVLATFFYPESRPVRTDYKSRIAESKSLTLCQQGIESQSLTF